MPGNPIAKSQRITALAERFNQLASDFDELLPTIYRYSGQPPTGDHRAEARAAADQHMITTAAALCELRDVLRDHAKLP